MVTYGPTGRLLETGRLVVWHCWMEVLNVTAGVPSGERLSADGPVLRAEADDALVIDDVRSPKILEVSWGYMKVEGIGEGKDFKLYPGGGREWDWNETGTGHSPGIQPVDVEELLAHGAEVVVLSRGMYRRLQVDPRTLEFLAARSVAAQVAETREAVRIYNDLADRAPVAGLFHSTC